MRTVIVVLLLSCYFFRLHAQEVIRCDSVSDHSIHVFGSNFEGVILKNYYDGNSELDETKQNKRFIPTTSEISIAEQIFQISLYRMSKKKSKFNSAEIVYKSLKNYLRQYGGYIDKEGNRIIAVNAFIKGESWAFEKGNKNTAPSIPRWLDSVIVVFDGGTSFFHTGINLTTGKLIYFGVNGVA